MESFCAAGVIDQRGLEAFGRGDGEEGGDDAGGGAGEDVVEGGEGAGGGVGETGFDRVEGEEADGVFGDGALYGCECELELYWGGCGMRASGRLTTMRVEHPL